MKHFRKLIVLAGLLYCAAASAQSISQAAKPAANVLAGTIDLIGGDAQIVQDGKPARRAAVGDAVNEGDTLITGKDGEVHLTMLDSGFMALRPNTRIKVVSYKADGGDDDKGVFQLITGGLRSITGWIGKFNRTAYKVRTPTATIGIRGTDHETWYIPEGSPDGEAGTYDKVFAGETTIETNAGQTEVNPNQAGFVSSASGQQPRVLGRVPGFFRPGPHEDLINSKHAEIQKMIIQRREERRKIIAEKLALLVAARTDFKAQKERNQAATAERKAAAQAQRLETEEQAAALHERELALQEKLKSIRTMRRTIQERSARDLARNEGLREQLRAVRETGRDVINGFKEIQEARRALSERNAAANEARKADADEHRRNTETQLAALSEREKALQQKQNTIQQMRLAISDKNTENNGGDQPKEGNPGRARKAANDALNQAIESANQERKDILEAQNTLFESNIAATEARMMALQEQRHRSEERRAAFNAKEEELRERQTANEAALESIQERGASERGRLENLRPLLDAVRQAAAAARQERSEIRDARKALHAKNMAALEADQQDALDQLQALRQKHRELRDKHVDLQQERESMHEEIKMLFAQEQQRYREELKADRQLGTAQIVPMEDNQDQN